LFVVERRRRQKPQDHRRRSSLRSNARASFSPQSIIGAGYRALSLLWRQLQALVPATGHPASSLQRSENDKAWQAGFFLQTCAADGADGGPGTLPETLGDAARFIGLMQPWRQARPHWEHCAGEILKAAESGKHPDILEATRCLQLALRKANWLDR